MAATARLYAATASSPRNPGRSGGAGGIQKTGLAAAVAALRAAHPHATVTLWAEDEHRLGSCRWCAGVGAKGTTASAHIERHYEWLYVYGFARPSTGQRWWCLLPIVTREAFRVALTAFARHEGIDATHSVVLVIDQAGWHISPRLEVPEGIALVLPPSYSPQLQRAERLWTLVDEPLANRACADLDGLEAVLIERCPHAGDRSSAPQSPHPLSLVAAGAARRRPTQIIRFPYKWLSGQERIAFGEPHWEHLPEHEVAALIGQDELHALSRIPFVNMYPWSAQTSADG